MTATLNGYPQANGATTPELIEMAQQAGLTTVTEIAAAIGKDKSTVSRHLSATKPATPQVRAPKPTATAATPRPAAVKPGTPATTAKRTAPAQPSRRAVLGAIAITACATGVLSAITTRWVASASFTGWTAWLAPVAIEGAALALAIAVDSGLPVPKVARWMGWWLVAIAVACNAAHVLALRPDWLLVPVLSGFPVSLAVLVLTLRAMREAL